LAESDRESRVPDGIEGRDAIGRNLEAFLSNITVGVAVTRGGALAWVSPALARICSVASGEELIGKPIDALWSDVGAGLPGACGLQPTEVEIRRADGERARGRVHCLAVDAASGSAAPGESLEIWMVDDVTPLARREEELLRLGRELAGARREIESLRACLDGEAEQREQLLGVVSHELRTPVTVISGYSRLLLAGEVGPLNEEQSRFLVECQKSCKRLDDFIGHLLEASRAIHGETPLDLVAAPLGTTLRGVVGFLRPLVDERGLRVDVDLHPEAQWARFDADRVEQILTNLLGNAVKYANPGGRVTVATRPLAAAGRRFVEVAVTDDGPGIPREDRERIFEPYVRGSRGRGEGGLGLGLAICKRLVEAHGGAITLSDAPGGGSRFAFSLPAADPAATADSRES